MNNTYAFIKTSLGNTLIVARGNALVRVCIEEQKNFPRIDNSWVYAPHNEVILMFVSQLEAYMQGEIAEFSVPYELPQGSSFSTQVWQALAQVHYGSTISYTQLAQSVGFTKRHVRAVARAVANNPLLIVLPCHRIIGSNGSLTGFAAGLPLKKRLLALEASRGE